MKLFDSNRLRPETMSPPPWGRGLKRCPHPGHGEAELVAPPVGAWIETFSPGSLSRKQRVAPPVGAWIET